MELFKKINFKQPKYILPALVYFPLLFTGYFVIDMMHTKKAEVPDPSLQSTEYINPNLPQPTVKEGLEGKMESMTKSFGKIDDHSAVGNIDREDADASKEEYQSKYSDEDLQAMEGSGEPIPGGQIEEQLRRSAERAAAMQQQAVALNKALFCDVNPMPVKYAMEVLGFAVGGCRLPLVSLSDSAKRMVEEAVNRFSAPCTVQSA